MGRNLLLNMADKGFPVIGNDKDPLQVKALKQEANNNKIHSTNSLEEFISTLQTPRLIMLLVPAGAVVDVVIHELLPHLSTNDMIIDGGNSYYADTGRREAELKRKGINFLGLGISGGAAGARLGPSMMAGGSLEAYQRVENIFNAVAAKVNNEPCVAYLGPGSAGHYVKMVHNGIEYGIMQLIAETYDIMRRGLGLNNKQLQEVYAEWNNSELESFLMEVTAQIFSQPDELTNGALIDYILDSSKQKGTGKWTLQNALELGVPVPILDTAVAMRYMSGNKKEREEVAKIFNSINEIITEDKTSFISQLKSALYFSFIITYSQGMSLMKEASREYQYNLNLKKIVKIWRGGCIIRANLLEHINAALTKKPDLSNLLLSPAFSEILLHKQRDLRKVIKAAIDAGIPVPGLMASLAYFDAFRSHRLPANLIQAQRDFFGAHTYERIDREGTFRTHWGKKT